MEIGKENLTEFAQKSGKTRCNGFHLFKFRFASGDYGSGAIYYSKSKKGVSIRNVETDRHVLIPEPSNGSH